LVEEGRQYDIVCALEIIEHVEEPSEFLKTISQLLKPSGILFLSTFNKTPLSYFGGIVLAEDILKLVPKGTHEHQKFIPPNDLDTFCSDAGLQTISRKGFWYSIFSKKFQLIDENVPLSTQINYVQACMKK
jgi:2-polyprenyl-6-hydroxyphenyl methylase / 3-demethylubiquinone-9 3-methyltransferase